MPNMIYHIAFLRCSLPDCQVIEARLASFALTSNSFRRVTRSGRNHNEANLRWRSAAANQAPAVSAVGLSPTRLCGARRRHRCGDSMAVTKPKRTRTGMRAKKWARRGRRESTGEAQRFAGANPCGSPSRRVRVKMSTQYRGRSSDSVEVCVRCRSNHRGTAPLFWSRTSRTFWVRASGVNGFCRNGVPSLRMPCRTTASSV
jgi:hypothetical protein